MDLQAIFSRLFDDYKSLNPSVDKIHTLLKNRNETIVNDHIAFRTYNLPQININVLAKAFEVRGYKVKGNYRFKEKKLTANHYENEDFPNAPKIFISQLEVSELSKANQMLINEHYQYILNKLPQHPDIIFANNMGFTPNYKKYQQLREESEYAAWMYVFGFRANHFTIFINHLNNLTSLEDFNEYILENNFVLNASGGIIKGSKEQFLKQSSILADKVNIAFTEDIFEVPACYYEFAQRFPLSNGHLFQGFIAGSADKIFESTDFRK
ncbi:DUF1338 domain-containing protein [Labilibacter marinus]|uniref:DUF1338 domain-containing protein n=1 Tax=Labilibacter marinus TaxID=1477105 RepID=UPI000836068D|nr:DUF1338 domain-containing protein [Labilibacter marinus]